MGVVAVVVVVVMTTCNYLQISVYNVLLMTVMHSRNNLNTITTTGVNNIQKYK